LKIVLFKRFRWAFLAAATAILLTIVLYSLRTKGDIAVIPPDQPATESAAVNTIEPSVSVQYEDAQQWPLSPDSFRTDAAAPTAIVRTEQYSVYVQDNKLYYADYLTEPRLLLEWNQGMDARAWINNSSILFGAQIPNGEDGNRGIWDVMKHNP
jgi:hypothetical protein